MSYFDKVTVTDGTDDLAINSDGSLNVHPLDGDGNQVGAQYPLSVDGDQVYEKDIDVANSSIGDFSGAIVDLFNSRTSTITTETDNPSLTIALKRPIQCHDITLVTSSGNFSNVTIVAKDAAGTTLETIDDSANNTDYTARQYNFTSIDHFCVLDISFTTTDTVTLSFCLLHKSHDVDAHLVALKPDGTDTHINATAGGNLKVSVEEFEETAFATGLQVRDPLLAIAAGDITNHSVVNKFGSSPSITAANNWEVWDGASAYTWPTSATITHIRAGVDSATMRGLDVEVQGLNSTYDLVTQTATLDGTDATTEVALGTALIRVFRMKVVDTSVTDQEIWVGPTGFATKQAIIQAGMNQTLMAIYTVPNGYTAYVTNYYCDYVRDAVKDPDGIQFYLWARDNANGYAKQIKHQKGIPKQAGGFQHHFKPYFKVTQKHDIFISAYPDGAAAHVHAGFDIILVAN